MILPAINVYSDIVSDIVSFVQCGSDNYNSEKYSTDMHSDVITDTVPDNPGYVKCCSDKIYMNLFRQFLWP